MPLAHAPRLGYQKLERELPSWAKLHHQNILPLYGACISRTLPQKGSYGRVGIVMDIGPRPYMVSGPSYTRNHKVDPNS